MKNHRGQHQADSNKSIYVICWEGWARTHGPQQTKEAMRPDGDLKDFLKSQRHHDNTIQVMGHMIGWTEILEDSRILLNCI